MNDFIDVDDPQYDDRARALIRIGRRAIAREDPAALDDYFSDDFRFHGPDGDLDFPGLRAFFAQMRAAFTDFYCERREIVSHGDFVGARTEMGGVFTDTFQPSPVGPVSPTGRRVTLPLINLFRYGRDGRLMEEWVQYDNLAWLRQLGLDVTPRIR